MPIESFGNGGMVITGEAIEVYRLLALRSALKLETKGMKRRGASVHSVIKRQFGLKGNKEKVLVQYEDLLREKGILK